jgi:hypothetical protein
LDLEKTVNKDLYITSKAARDVLCFALLCSALFYFNSLFLKQTLTYFIEINIVRQLLAPG